MVVVVVVVVEVVAVAVAVAVVVVVLVQVVLEKVVVLLVDDAVRKHLSIVFLWLTISMVKNKEKGNKEVVLLFYTSAVLSMCIVIMLFV